jgi:hypothetical protein
MQPTAPLLKQPSRPSLPAAGGSLGAAVCCVALAACAPGLNWRDVRVEGTPLRAQLPCKPSHQAREIALGTQRVQMNLLSCTAGEALYAVAWMADLDPAQMPHLAGAWNQAATSQVAAPNRTALPFRVPGANQRPSDGRWRSQGRRPDGSALSQDMASFSHGASLFQATILASQPDLAAAELFFSSLSFADLNAARTSP